MKACENCGVVLVRKSGEHPYHVAHRRYCNHRCAATHHNQKRLTAEFVLRRVDKSGGESACWPFMGRRSRVGYGRIQYKRKTRMAHSVALEIATGHRPSGMIAMHLCDNPPCCNPTHLRWGTYQDNADDAVSKRRHAFGSRSGRSKFCESDIASVIGRVRKGEPPLSIAQEFGCTREAVYAILNGRNWKHVPRA